MLSLNPYLNFQGNCREAMEFYRSCLGGELTLQTIGESPLKDQMPAENHGLIMHSVLKNPNSVIMASDMMMPGQEYKTGNTISLCVNCESGEEISSLFEKISASGKVDMPLEEQFWGAMYAEITDKFGIKWALNWDK